MSIKEIADLYNVKYVAVNPDQLPTVVFNKENAPIIIEKLRFECKPLLGCDVYRIKNGAITEVLLPNLYVNRNANESLTAFLQRSCNESLEFVTNYPQYTNDIFFDFVAM